MDPNACLGRFLDALGVGDRDEAIAALDDLGAWLRSGGALPCQPRPVVDVGEEPAGPMPENLARLAQSIADYVLHVASGRCPGEPVGINLSDLNDYVWNELSLPESEPGPEALLQAMPLAEAIVRKKHPRATAGWRDLRPSHVDAVIWTGL